MRMLAIVLALTTIFGVGFAVNYFLQDVSIYIILKNILALYIIGVSIVEGVVFAFKKEEIKPSQEGKVDTDRQNKN